MSFASRKAAVCAGIMLAASMVGARAPVGPSIVSYQLIDQTVNRSDSLLTYRVTLANPGPSIPSATGHVTLAIPGVTVLDDTVFFDAVAANDTELSEDTFSILVEKKTPSVDLSTLTWNISIPACPACIVGPALFERTEARPSVASRAFTADASADHVIDVEDSSIHGPSASVTLNGQVILPPRTAADIGPRHVRMPVVLQTQNLLLVQQSGGELWPGVVVRVLAGTKSVGSTGGTIKAAGITLDIPPTALTGDVEITVYPTTGVTPPNFVEGTTPLGRSWSFEPHGLAFDLPVTASVGYGPVLSQVTSSDDIGVVHWDPQGTYVDVASATDDTQSQTLTFTLDHFSYVGLIQGAAKTPYSLYPMRWGIPVVTVSESNSEFNAWANQTSGIVFSPNPPSSASSANIVIHRVTNPAPTPCPPGHVRLDDALSAVCLPSLTRTLGANDQVHIWLATTLMHDVLRNDRVPNATVLRHDIGHALGIAHPWRNAPSGSSPSNVPVMEPVRQIACDTFFCLPITPWSIFSRSGLHATDIAAIQAKYGPLAPPPPNLQTPVANAQIVQDDPSTGCLALPGVGRGFKLPFDWSNVSGATSYRVIAYHGPTPTSPIVNTVVTQSNHTSVHCGSFVIPANLTGWFWQVQSIANGLAGPFSSPRPFSFLPCVLPSGAGCTALPQPQTSLVSVDDPVYGVGSITRDTTTGLEWLDLTLTRNLTAAQVAIQFPGFRHATSTEVFQFFTDARIPFIVTAPNTVFPSAANVPAVPNLMSMWGVTDFTNVGSPSSWAYLADGPTPTIRYIAVLHYPPPGGVAFASTRGSTSSGSAISYAGHALVR